MLRARIADRPGPKRGAALFEGTDYPRRWEDYIGQPEAKAFLQAAVASALFRHARLDHILIASGTPGIGKTALVRLIAQDLDVGVTEVQGVLDVSDGIRVLSAMKDGDILFWDEIHQAIMRGKAKIEWLLSYLQDGVIVTPMGITHVPRVTVVAASTEAQRLPATVLKRFTVKPVLESYTPEQASKIAELMARTVFSEIGLTMPSKWNREAIVEAANRNPREINQLLRILRDSAIATGFVGDVYPMDQMYRWAGLTKDGLDKLAQEYLAALFTQPNFRAGEKSVAQMLGEPVPPRHTEELLIQKGFIRVCGQGRELTAAGVERTNALIDQGVL